MLFNKNYHCGKVMEAMHSDATPAVRDVAEHAAKHL